MEKAELYILRRSEVAKGTHPGHWQDPEGLTAYPEHHRRMWVDNPLTLGGDDPVRAYVLVDGQVAGRVSLLAGTVLVAGEAVPVLWGFNLIVSTRFRGRGLATKLVRAWQDAHHTALGTNVNRPSIGIYHKLGWTELNMPNYTAICRSRKFVDGYLRVPLASAVAASLADGWLALWRLVGRWTSGTAAGRLHAEAADAMSPEFDAALARPKAPAMTFRSAAWINWQLRVADAHPHERQYRLCYVLDGPRVAGYFLAQMREMPVLRRRFRQIRLGSLRDWGVFVEQGIDEFDIFWVAARHLREWGADLVVITTDDGRAGRALRRSGYFAVDPLRTVFHADPSSPLAGPRYRDPRSWRFTPIEADGLVA